METEQLSIFDFLGEFATVPEEEMVETVGNRLGVLEKEVEIE